MVGTVGDANKLRVIMFWGFKTAREMQAIAQRKWIAGIIDRYNKSNMTGCNNTARIQHVNRVTRLTLLVTLKYFQNNLFYSRGSVFYAKN